MPKSVINEYDKTKATAKLAYSLAIALVLLLLSQGLLMVAVSLLFLMITAFMSALARQTL